MYIDMVCRRMAGRDYLKQVLLPLLDELLSDNTINHEINPLEVSTRFRAMFRCFIFVSCVIHMFQVYMQLVLAEEARTNAPAQRSREVSVEQAAADPEVAKIVAENILTHNDFRVIDMRVRRVKILWERSFLCSSYFCLICLNKDHMHSSYSVGVHVC